MVMNRPKGSDILTFNNFTLDFNYFRHDGDYSDIHLYLRRKEDESTYDYLLPLTANDSGASVVYDFGAIKYAQSATICIKRGDEIIDYSDTVIDLTRADKSGYLALYAIQNTSEILSAVTSEDEISSFNHFVTAHSIPPAAAQPSPSERETKRELSVCPRCLALAAALLLCAAGLSLLFRKRQRRL
jgi:hypothetical protein